MTNIQEIATEAINQYKKILIHHGIDAGKEYPQPLPSDLHSWYVYMENYGHSILCINTQDEKIAFTSQDNLIYLIPMPVKTVINNYRVRNNIIICTTALPFPEADIEF